MDVTTIAFIRSFHEDKDNLLMWNSSYGDTGKGVSLGIPYEGKGKLEEATARTKDQIKQELDTFSRETPAHVPVPTQSQKNGNESKPIPMRVLSFAKVIYLTAEKNSTAEEKLTAEEKEIKKKLKSISEALDALTGMYAECQEKKVHDILLRAFLPISHLIKSATYAHEKEWRLLYITTLEQGKKDCYINKSPVLHVETEKILFTDKEHPEEICLGPRMSEHPDMERLKIKHLFEFDGKGECVNIFTSEQRFRG